MPKKLRKRKIREQRFLLFSDLHMSNTHPMARGVERGRTDRLIDAANVFASANRLAIKYNCIAAKFLGDLLHESRVDEPTLETLTQCVRRWSGVPLVLLPGNHTAHNVSCGLFVESYLKGLNEQVVVTDSFARMSWGWCTFSYLPYTDDARAKKFLSQLKPTGAAFDGLAMHQGIVGCRHAGWTCDRKSGLASELFSKFHLAVSGHFHPHQTFDGGFYVGSPMQLDFRDGGEKRGVVLLTVRSDGTWSKRLIGLKMPKFITIKARVDANGVSCNEDIDRLAGHYVRLRYTGTVTAARSFKDDIDQLVSRIASVARGVKKDPALGRDRKKRQPQIRLGMSMGEMIPRYVKSGVQDLADLNGSRLTKIMRKAAEESRKVS